MAVLCDSCGWFGGEDSLIRVMVGLSDDAWGAGESFIYEYWCPECNSMDLTDGVICKHCDEFVAEGKECDCGD